MALQPIVLQWNNQSIAACSCREFKAREPRKIIVEHVGNIREPCRLRPEPADAYVFWPVARRCRPKLTGAPPPTL